jgi:hypothetical protein
MCGDQNHYFFFKFKFGCVLRFFELQQTSNDFDQLISQTLQVSENYKLSTCI